MITVLPTQAHPKRPTFPHLSIGAIRSTTLIQVSKTSAFVVKSLNFGASLWIGSKCLASGLSHPSIGSHKTLNILHKTVSQTGTLIGAQEASTSNPLFSHSTGFIAIVLTTQSQSCCCTSKITFDEVPFTSRDS
jgi:hypothetical protein